MCVERVSPAALLLTSTTVAMRLTNPHRSGVKCTTEYTFLPSQWLIKECHKSSNDIRSLCCVQLDVNVMLPSPDLLRRKIIVKNKKKSSQSGAFCCRCSVCDNTVVGPHCHCRANVKHVKRFSWRQVSAFVICLSPVVLAVFFWYTCRGDRFSDFNTTDCT